MFWKHPGLITSAAHGSLADVSDIWYVTVRTTGERQRIRGAPYPIRRLQRKTQPTDQDVQTYGRNPNACLAISAPMDSRTGHVGQLCSFVLLVMFVLNRALGTRLVLPKNVTPAFPVEARR